MQTLWERGLAHEQEYVQYLEKEGFEVSKIDGAGVTSKQIIDTVSAMHDGAQIIFQGALSDGRWTGRVDILRRVDVSSELGEWSYEVIDTKLARETKGGTILQLCLYSDLVRAVQGALPEYMYVVAPWSEFEPQVFRTNDYAAYYRLVKARLETSLEDNAVEEIYPDPKEHCDICRWRLQCDKRRHDDDHLCLVAGISKLQINELRRQKVDTVSAFAALPLPLPWKPERGAVQTYERIHEQARVQIEGREKGEPVFEVLEPEPGFGLACLPQPSAGDIFLDLEGDPFVGEAGLEYLFGYVIADGLEEFQYTGLWAQSHEDEKRNFEQFVDWAMDHWRQYPDFHFYHFAPYEPGALKRLMGRFASREEEIDRMLRAGLFVDLYGVIRRGIRASVESYSIKTLEQFYGFERSVDLPEANRALAAMHACLELGEPEGISEDHKAIIQGYNRDDCLSAHNLRNWLEDIRSKLVEGGAQIDRPPAGEGDPSEAISEWQQRINELSERIAGGLPAETAERTDEQQSRWLLANILDWHRREDKAVWWEYFRLAELPMEDLIDERSAISGLTFDEATGGTAKAPIHRYRFPIQETDLRGGEALRSVGGEKFGSVHEINFENRIINIKKRMDSAEVHPAAIFAHDIVNAGVLAEALIRIGEHVADHDISGEGQYQVARNLLLRTLPVLDDEEMRQPEESALEAAIRIAPKLKNSVLPIQGPPGAGKTYTGARMICEAISKGARIGITANSHKVIRNLLDEVLIAAEERDVDLKAIQKVSGAEEGRDRIAVTKKNEDVFEALGASCQIAAGTAWLWARPEAQQSVDVLFVDEAAQMSLANVLAISHAGTSLVLLGDPQQLDQPMQGSHPEGTDVSALNHLLGEHQTISSDHGLFLEETYRLHPEICNFTSEMFYESRLKPRPGLENQQILSTGPVHGSGLRFMPVSHGGNQSSSPEEANHIFTLVRDFLERGSSWVDKDGNEKSLCLDDILIIAPYNAQVFEIQERLPEARVGTVDKFQGQEAPIVIYSMATSTPKEAPHGMEFLYSLNRLNVATSRARCISIVIGSPDLFEPECRTPRQIQLANAFCRYREMAETITL